MRSPRSRRAGFTLLEIMAVMTVLALVLGLLIVSLTSLLRLEQADSAFYDRVMNNDRVADRFRTDVAQATSAPTEWSTYQAGTHCLILEQPNGMHVVYQWDTGSNKLVRWQVQEDEVNKLPEPLPVDAESVELLRPSANLCTLRILVHAGPPTVAHTTTSEFVVALGGERR